ncbi:hypothetical protein MA16_Dca006788 [Dendrobium catenatum]|uniref:Uncharacterized protein n=1 Tax=Dendrobium catenatum TaxID=906689 RepID=A0A2I0W964_9ASPA|nr:hypothetical protein MA16_Dca006788 [Dendrobium catenatum]
MCICLVLGDYMHHKVKDLVAFGKCHLWVLHIIALNLLCMVGITIAPQNLYVGISCLL